MWTVSTCTSYPLSPGWTALHLLQNPDWSQLLNFDLSTLDTEHSREKRRRKERMLLDGGDHRGDGRRDSS